MRRRRHRVGLAVGVLALAVVAAACLPAHPKPAPGPGWSKYTVAQGAHSASVSVGSSATRPLAGFTNKARRAYHFIFDSSARYVITDPVQPEDQFDWNKLPGLSDCGDIDLSRNGYMFAWRWRTDTSPRRLEITAYANNNGVHLTTDPIVTFTAATVDARKPMWFDLSIDQDTSRYRFLVQWYGPTDEVVEKIVYLPRQCPSTGTGGLKWASGLYFGGTSTAPQTITGWINEPA